MTEDRSVRGEWVQGTLNWWQGLVGQFMLADISDLPAVTTSALQDAPAPVNHAESLLQRAIVLGQGLQLVQLVHSHEDRSVPCLCFGECGQALVTLWNTVDSDVLERFAAWIEMLVETYNRSHPPTLAERAARVIRQCAPERMGTARVAAQCACTVPTLRHAFCRRYGVSLREYQRIARVIVAAPRVRRGAKIDVVALEAGYRSKKDFYKVFRQVTGLTPVQFRNLPSSEAAQLVSDARSRLVLRGHVKTGSA